MSATKYFAAIFIFWNSFVNITFTQANRLITKAKTFLSSKNIKTCLSGIWQVLFNFQWERGGTWAETRQSADLKKNNNRRNDWRKIMSPVEWFPKQYFFSLPRYEKRRTLLWCDPGLRGSSQGHLGCLKSILLRQNKHSHPLIYMRGMKSDDLFAIVDNWAISKMVFGKNLSGSNPLGNMTYPLFSSPTFYMSGAVWFLYVVGLLQIKQNEEKVELRKFHLSSSCTKRL